MTCSSHKPKNLRVFKKGASVVWPLFCPLFFLHPGGGKGGLSPINKAGDLESKLIVPKNNGLKITGTFWMKYLMIFLIRIGVRKNGI